MKSDEYYEYMVKRFKNDILSLAMFIVFLPILSGVVVIFIYYTGFSDALVSEMEKPILPGERILKDVASGVFYIVDGAYGYMASLPIYVNLAVVIIIVGFSILCVLFYLFDDEFDESEYKRKSEDRLAKMRAKQKKEGFAKRKAKKTITPKETLDSPVEKVDWTGD